MRKELVILENENRVEIGLIENIDKILSKFKKDEVFNKVTKTFDISDKLNSYLLKDSDSPHHAIATVFLPFDTNDKAQDLIAFVKEIDGYTMDNLEDVVELIGGKIEHLPKNTLEW